MTEKNRLTIEVWHGRSFARGILLLAFTLVLNTIGAADTIVAFDFTTQSLNAVIGTGVASAVNVNSGFVNLLSPPSVLFAFQGTGFPEQGSGDKTAGFEFDVSTVGFQGISVSWDEALADHASRFWSLQFSFDRVNFATLTAAGDPRLDAFNTWNRTSGPFRSFNAWNRFDGMIGFTTFNNFNFNAWNVNLFDDRQSIEFRLLTSFGSPGYDAFATGNPADYDPAAPASMGSLTVQGTELPEPSTLAIVGFIALAFWYRLRKHPASSSGAR